MWRPTPGGAGPGNEGPDGPDAGQDAGRHDPCGEVGVRRGRAPSKAEQGAAYPLAHAVGVADAGAVGLVEDGGEGHGDHRVHEGASTLSLVSKVGAPVLAALVERRSVANSAMARVRVLKTTGCRAGRGASWPRRSPSIVLSVRHELHQNKRILPCVQFINLAAVSSCKDELVFFLAINSSSPLRSNSVKSDVHDNVLKNETNDSIDCE